MYFGQAVPLHYTLARDSRELQRFLKANCIDLDYTLARDSRELQLRV